MAAVYQARDSKRGTVCAIKEMSLSTVPTSERPQAIQNFLAEARILSRLNHPNLPAFTDFFTEGARYFLVMEYIDGQTLEDMLEENGAPFSERRVLGWARQLCDVLEYLHSQQPPIIFRDMKPSNIMLTRTGRIKLIDFGIARLFRRSGGQDTQLLGTPGFAPPEQYGSAQTDERTDIYSLAMTLYQLLTNAVNDQGFGLRDVHRDFPHISSPVARALEKATSLKPEDRYESIVVFRRALLGVGTFRFENGGEATTPEELANLCAHYPEEAADYLFAGEIESWLQEIGATDLARVARRIRATVGDPEMGVTRFLQAVMGPNAQTRSSTTIQARGNSQTGAQPRVSSSGSRAGRVNRTPVPAVIVNPKTIDFGQVYPGLSAPIIMTISGSRGALVSGSIHPVESWIVVDSTTFDGMKIPISVRVDSTRLRGSTHYTGTIMVTPDGGSRESAVTVELDVLGYTTSTIARRHPGQSQGNGAADDEDEDEDDVTTATASGMRMAAQATGTVPPPVYNSARTNAYKAKYGLPNSGGWDPLGSNTARQQTRMRYVSTFLAAFVMAAFFYLFLAYLPPLVNSHISLLPPNPWFTAILLGLAPFTTLGAVIVNWGSAWTTRETINRVCTGLSCALLVLGLSELAWQNLSLSAPPLQLLVMLLITAAGATVGTIPRISEAIINASIWAMQHMRWLVISLAMLVGGGLGFALTNGFAFGCFAPFGILLGIGVGAFLVLRVDRLMKQKHHP